MSIALSPVTPNFAAEIGDVDLSKPLADEDFAAIQQAFWKYSVLIFPEQHLTSEQHLAFSAKWGPVENSRTLDPTATQALGSIVEGRITQVRVQPGDRVRRGQHVIASRHRRPGKFPCPAKGAADPALGLAAAKAVGTVLDHGQIGPGFGV